MSEPSEPGSPPPGPAPDAAPPAPAALAPATALFERGDFLGARREVERILATAPGIEIAARALLDRMAPDRWAVRIGLLVLVVLALVTGLYVR